MEKKFLEGLVRKTWDTPEGRATVEKSRAVQFVISSSAKDRHKTVLNMDGWQLKNYNNNPIVGYQHNVYGDNMCVPPNPDDVLGVGRAWIEEVGAGVKVLMGEVTFDSAEINPLAEKVFQKILAGSLRATSVGFYELGKGKKQNVLNDQNEVVDSTYYFAGQELLEYSIVNIPSNPEALKKSLVNHTRAGINFLRSMGLTKEAIRKVADDIINGMDDNKEDEEEVTTKDLPGPDPDSSIYKEKLAKRKIRKS